MTMRVFPAIGTSVLAAHRENRKALVERMAADLVNYDAFRTEADAIRSLFGRGYSMGDIVMVVDDARQVAMQAVVAREISRP